ncbi:hypothetical protein NTD84_03355 [Pseudomonas sp. 14P_8.1_Bac3]|uniref:hypothetical protein n=1 Tax=Pseudomonas sp. 14P_8.1_Bac3 TaxID=2971621 RepID=UPI0021C7F950|nr:hypothetical protein [Pseudomonas sp. 14P_8.1_Bac3]MCU1758758.1 hypothetical protein [Pseudomonas sp. 14P_8.1_Bac3]
MNAYVSTELSMIQMLDPQRHELALLQEAFLNKGGTIEVLQGPSFVPPPVRHEPPRKISPVRAKAPEPAPRKLDKITLRELEREERAAARARERIEMVARIRKLAETMTYSQAVEATGFCLRTLQKIAVDAGFKFQPAANNTSHNLKRHIPDEAKDANDAERIKAFMEIGLSRHQAMQQAGVGFKTFVRILDKFDINYPKRRAGPHPAFFSKPKEVSV